MAQKGQLIDLRCCEMPQHSLNAGHFESRVHFPDCLGSLPPNHQSQRRTNRLSNVQFLPYVELRWTTAGALSIRTMLVAPLEVISCDLARKGIRTPHGHAKWSSASSPKAFNS